MIQKGSIPEYKSKLIKTTKSFDHVCCMCAISTTENINGGKSCKIFLVFFSYTSSVINILYIIPYPLNCCSILIQTLEVIYSTL